jgi:hypothetical protein
MTVLFMKKPVRDMLIQDMIPVALFLFPHPLRRGLKKHMMVLREQQETMDAE